MQTVFLVGIGVAVAVVAVLAVLLTIVCKKFSGNKYVKKVIDVAEKQKKALFWNGIIRTSL